MVVIFVSGCKVYTKDTTSIDQYYYLSSLNTSCNIPVDLIEIINSASWEKVDSYLLIGELCEAISLECTTEYPLFRFNNNSLIHRIHFMGSPDDTFHLEYKNKRYSCK